MEELAVSIADHVKNPEKCTEHRSTQVWNHSSLIEDVQRFKIGDEETEMSLGTGFYPEWGTNMSLRINAKRGKHKELAKVLLPALKEVDERWEEAEEEGRFYLKNSDR
jgi:hypothetical protein